MSKLVKKEMEVKGILHTDYGNYTLLDTLPTKTVLPAYLKTSNMWAFYVKDYHDDFAKYIFMAGNNWIIRPMSDRIITLVNFWEDEENIKVDSLDN